MGYWMNMVHVGALVVSTVWGPKAYSIQYEHTSSRRSVTRAVVVQHTHLQHLHHPFMLPLGEKLSLLGKKNKNESDISVPPQIQTTRCHLIAQRSNPQTPGAWRPDVFP